ncbi:hypothetical protein GSVR_20820 [Geobacter sp. SVR]|nr:hypothetical protein GSVR_20820 [Geobacter sp. SVR]
MPPFYRLSFSLIGLLIIFTALLAGCAASSTAVMDEEIVTNEKPMATYKRLLLSDFELDPELYTDLPEAGPGERERRYAQVPAQLTDQVQRYVKSRHIYDSVSRDELLSPTTLVLKGRFTRMGRFRISIEAMLLDGASGQEVAYFRQTLWDVFDTTEAVGRLGHEIADFIDRIQYK